ncbi:hypothetical protein GW915_12095 [bacterium]|nr:hypothetical protein [bacterium]
MGEDAKFGRWQLKYDTAGNYAGVTLEWQYWNGTAWTTLTVTDPTSFFTAAVGTYNITWTAPADWATTAVDGITKYWIRCTVTALATPTLTTAPLGSRGWEGTGAGTAEGASVTGEDLFANIYTLGTIEGTPAPQIYIFQIGERIAEWSNLTNWDRGHIDVLIKVKEAGTEIAAGTVTVFARQSGDLYDNYEIDLSAGGRNAVPLGTSDDLNENSGEFYLLYDAETATFTTLAQIITGGTSGAKAELVAVTDWGTTGVLTLRDVQGTFQDNETITGSNEGSATVNGTIGDTYLAYDAETAPFAVGAILTGGTSTAKRIIRGLQDDGTTGKLVLQVSRTVTGANRNPYYIIFQDSETITDDQTTPGSATANGTSITIVSGWDDITIAFVNGTVKVGAITGTFTPGERVTYPTNQSAILLKAETGSLTLGNATSTDLKGKTITGDISGASCSALADFESAQSYNANTAVFTDETADIASATANDVALPPIQATTAGDCIYVGMDTKFGLFRLNVGTAGVYSATLVWEYWDGTAWATLTVTDGTSGFTVAGTNDVTFTPPANWATTAVDTITKYWIRCRASAVTSITTAPLGTQGWSGADSVSTHTTTKAFEQQSAYPYDVIVNAGGIYAAGRTLAQVYEYFKYVCQAGSSFDMYTVADSTITILDGQEYIIAYTGYAPSKAGPLGTFAGGKYFGAQGIWIEGMATKQSYTFKDSDGILRDPYASITIAITNTLSGDRVSVFRTSAGAIDKEMYTSHPTNNVTGNTTFEVQETLPVDTPSLGAIRIVDKGTLVEQRHTYSSWSGMIFSGLSPVLQQTYDGADKCYIPFIDAEAIASSIEKIVLYAADRAVLVRARRKAATPILPFETSASVTTAGLTVAVIRTEDAIVT